MLAKPKTRWGAFGIHLALSAIVFVALLILIVVWLFPGGLYTATGGWQGVRIIAGVDIVLGPLLTLIVYNVAKPRLEMVRDLTIIATIQITALIAGMYVVYQQRPVSVTWVHDRFKVSRIGDYRDAGVADEDLHHLNPMTPVVDYIELPDDRREASTVLMTFALTGESLQNRTDLSAPLPDSPELAAHVMRYNAARGPANDDNCVPALVESRFGQFRLCYHVDSQRFSRLHSSEKS